MKLRLRGSIGLLGVLTTLVFASSAHAASVQPVFYEGNPTCATLGYDYGFKPNAGGQENAAGTYNDPNSGVVVTWSYTNPGDNGHVDWQSNINPEAVIVKGGDGANVYTYGATTMSDTNLVTPNNNNGRPAGLSHLVFCYNYKAQVSKTASTAYTRSYDWSVTKVADRTSLLLAEGETLPVVYTITADRTSVDSNFVVSGTITVTNPWSRSATIVSVTDSIPGAIVSCPASTALGAQSSVACTYTASLAEKTNGINTATAVVQYGAATPRTSTGSAPYSFGSPTTVVDASATLNDVRGSCPVGFVCTLASGDVPDDLVISGPFTLHYTVNIRAVACGQGGILPNVVTLRESDSGTEHTARASVTLASAGCVLGCTLTQGYWKTHSMFGPAPYDDAWTNLSPSGARTTFFLSGASWYQVLWTAPKGNPYYVLAHQYMAARLNVLNGAAVTPEVTSALAGAEAYFAATKPTDKLSKERKAQLLAWASTLDQYNNGLVGPGHCSE